MALGTGIEIPNNFDLNAPLPLDARFIAADETARDLIDPVARFEGLLVYCVAEAIMYQLQGGVTNGHWVVAGGGGGGTTPVVEHFTGDGSTAVFNLVNDPVTKENILVFIDGVRQETSVYAISTSTLVFADIPYNGAGIECVIGTTSTVNVPAAGSVTTASISAGAVTKNKLAALGQIVSSSSGSFSTSSVSSTYVDVTNLAVSITTTGRPVKLELLSDSSGSDSLIRVSRSNTQAFFSMRFIRASSVIARFTDGLNVAAATSLNKSCPPTAFHHTDFSVAGTPGTYAYKVDICNLVGSNSPLVEVTNIILVAYEI